MNNRVLVTNDDGIDSPGLHALARCAVEAGWEVLVAAPRAEASGTGAGLTAARDGRRVLTERRELPGLPGVEAYALEAHPGLIVLIGCTDGFGARPDLVLSGVNRGGNVGRAILHSGTVGAALTAGINGASALAVSLDMPVAGPVTEHWAAATTVVTGLLPWAAGLPAGSILNVNVPNRPGDPGEPVWAGLATYGRARSRVTAVREGTVEVGTVVEEGELEPDSDAALLAAGRVTVTALHSVSADTAAMRRPLPGTRRTA